jgi:hypothetical protein
MGRTLARLRPLIPIIATFPLSLLFSMSLFLTFAALRGPIPTADLAGLLVPSAIYDVVLASLIGPLAVAIVDRRAEAERPEW